MSPSTALKCMTDVAQMRAAIHGLRAGAELDVTQNGNFDTIRNEIALLDETYDALTKLMDHYHLRATL